MSGFAQSAQARGQADVADQNARLAQQEAAADAAKIGAQGNQIRGAQEAGAGASGVQGPGFADVIHSSDYQSALDAQTTLWDGKVRAANYQAQAEAARRAGTNAIIGGVIGAGADALSSYGRWNYLTELGKKNGFDGNMMVG